MVDRQAAGGQRERDVTSVGVGHHRAADRVPRRHAQHCALYPPALRKEKGKHHGGGACHGRGGGEQSARAQPARSRCRFGRCALAQQAIDVTEQEELALTVRAGADMREQGSIVTVVEQVWQSRPGLLVPHGDSSPSSVASRLRPRRFQLLTEPSGTCRRFAIALSLRSR